VRPVDVDETALWRRGASGDAEAFAAVFDLHRDQVFHQALRLVETWEEAEDVAAAAFLELWRRRRDVRVVGGSVLPWLLVTTANLARNSERARRRYRDFLVRLPRETRSPDAAEAMLDGTATAIDPRLRAALRALPAKDLHLLLLVAFADHTLADTAAVLGISPSAAKNRLQRARARLREQLDHPDSVRSAQEAPR
jgi:RNA polymerase sigma-70 factor (ECF subfamily)